MLIAALTLLPIIAAMIGYFVGYFCGVIDAADQIPGNLLLSTDSRRDVGVATGRKPPVSDVDAVDHSRPVSVHRLLLRRWRRVVGVRNDRHG